MPAASQWLAIHYTTMGQCIQMIFLQMLAHPLLLAHGDDKGRHHYAMSSEK